MSRFADGSREADRKKHADFYHIEYRSGHDGASHRKKVWCFAQLMRVV
jgi:hypothetical protein